MPNRKTPARRGSGNDGEPPAGASELIPDGRDYFDQLLERIRDIRASERRFYQKSCDIYTTSVDYDPGTEAVQKFFATVQNKLHWAAASRTRSPWTTRRVS